jgi:hypothetical protein
MSNQPSPRPIAAEARFLVIPEGVLLQRVGREMVLLHLASGHYFGLNEVGARILDLSCELAGPDAVAARLADEFDAPVEVLRHDLDFLVAELLAHDLVARSSA